MVGILRPNGLADARADAAAHQEVEEVETPEVQLLLETRSVARAY